MKKFSLYLMFCIFFVHASELEVSVSGLKNTQGQLCVGLYNSQKNFPNSQNAYKGIFLELDSQSVQYTFEDIADGEYAIAIYHDKNSNKKLDKNFFGIPQEEYAFSNKAKASFGPPSFDEAKFILKGNATIKIDMEQK
ncbi:DUF2141 domain-containing protein [bacterium]|nr:DUF2141 domain-containing protein [bacterium]MBU1995191.1 DUF2141 domain-containing protein [bacterium]